MTKDIFIDIDGTLLDYRSRLPESAREAIRLAKEKGHRIYLSTGRCRAEIYPFIWDLGIEGVICSNGTYVEYQGQPIFQKNLTLQEMELALEILQDTKLEFYLEGVEAVYRSPGLSDKMKTMFTEEFGTELFDRLSELMKETDQFIREDINKICFILNEETDLQALKDRFHPDLEINAWSIFGEKDEFGEVGPKGYSKATGIQVLLAHSGRENTGTYGFGDALNDIEMLQYCQFGTAMGNAKEELKAVADHITDNVEADGLYNAFLHFGLI